MQSLLQQHPPGELHSFISNDSSTSSHHSEPDLHFQVSYAKKKNFSLDSCITVCGYCSMNVLKLRTLGYLISGGSRIFEKGGRGNGKVTLGLLRLNMNV